MDCDFFAALHYNLKYVNKEKSSAKFTNCTLVNLWPIWNADLIITFKQKPVYIDTHNYRFPLFPFFGGVLSETQFIDLYHNMRYGFYMVM